MTPQDTPAPPLLFGKPYQVKAADCTEKLERLLALKGPLLGDLVAAPQDAAAISGQGSQDIDAAVAVEEAALASAWLLDGCCDAFELIEEERFDPHSIVSRARKRLMQFWQHLLQLEAQQQPGDPATLRLEAIGFTAGMMFSDSAVPARTDLETHQSITTCLHKACDVCLTLEQEFTKVAAQYRAAAQTKTADAAKDTSGDAELATAAALSYSRSKGRQNAS
jgi:hypothetical protein